MSAPVRARPAVGPDLAMCPRALLRTCEELGHDDAPAGLLLATGQLSAALHRAPDHVRDRVGRDGSLTGSVQPGGLLRAAAEGDVLTGEWAAVPGAADADWFVLAAERAADGQPVLVVLPAGRADRSAAAGGGFDTAGTRHVSVQGVTVDRDHIVPAFGPYPDGAQAPLPPPAVLRCAITGVALGVARRALHELVTTARQRSRLGAVTRMSEQPLLRVELNRAVLAFRAARQLALAELEELPPDGPGSGAVSLSRRTALAAALLHAHHASIDAVRFAFAKAGGSVLRTGHPLERCWRTAEALSCHPLYDDRAEREVARAQFGDYVSALWL
ncbi:acyl-CoA dehydrogenase family protein [Prauserella oleivorans]|uniref:Acyl-CoA dehydrogenase family protein n=1 Tax=Prauserella oleivorans TaxID=1478153 RepID=A0ABW5W6X8_9PSEU